MGRGKGGGGGGGGGGFRGRGLRGWFGFRAPAISPFTNDAIRHVAIERGFRDVNHLMANLGRQENEYISEIEALDIMAEELGADAMADFVMAKQFSKPGRCKSFTEHYKKCVKEQGSDSLSATSSLSVLRKFCGYTGDAEK